MGSLRPVHLLWSLLGGGLLLAFGGVFFLAWMTAVFLPGVEGTRSTVDMPVLGVWLEHAWVEPGRSADEVRILAENLRSRGVTDVFVHAGPLSADGTLHPGRYIGAQAFLQGMTEWAPEIRVQAWLGQVTTVWGGPMDFTLPTVREEIRRSAGAVLDAGFEGVHLNIEPIDHNNEDLLALLRGLSQDTWERGAYLSLAIDDVEPFLGAEALIRLCCRPRVTFWRPDYLVRVLSFVDQVAIMTYDTRLPHPAWYAWYVSLMTERVAGVVPEGKTVMMGLPTYETGNQWFDPRVENIASALAGYVHGRQRGPRPAGTLGVALYAYWETSPEEWDILSGYREE